MMFDAMRVVDADGVAMCDAHPDLEVFRLRLGKAIDYEFNEDTQTGLFQRRDPREGGGALVFGHLCLAETDYSWPVLGY